MKRILTEKESRLVKATIELASKALNQRLEKVAENKPLSTAELAEIAALNEVLKAHFATRIGYAHLMTSIDLSPLQDT